ncbi:MAG: NACHT domain-containing protein [Candidatus Viridilinea halotolerans]|uniref:NACHT domain-containing protein n=1 Tax=Candidatus Viridilinea halotolerans TaxID=2491704 RepID=A0A426UCF3_9CHLR|nr:MAG: NACHT domain-containing protein [Candidatus Viridilinea halotolerans]
MTDDLLARFLSLPPEEQQRLLAQSATASSAGVDLRGAQTGDVKMGDVAGRDVVKDVVGEVTLTDDAMIDGVVVGLNLGTIIYQRDPHEPERRRLVHYLAALAGALRRLPLRGLDGTLAEGQGVSLARVYVMLAVQRQIPVVVRDQRACAALFEENDAQKALQREVHPDYALPDRAIVAIWQRDAASGGPDSAARHAVVSEALHDHARLVILGDPGSGKSTLLRHFAWVLARRGLDQCGPETELVGWHAKRRRFPLLLPLRRLAGALVGAADPSTTLHQTLRTLLAEYGVNAADDLLTDVLVRGAAMLLLDGLDEVPVEATATSVDRATTLHAVRSFAERYERSAIVLTCRTRAFSDELRSALAWQFETLAPLTLGQIRHFVPAWYQELAERGHLQATQMAQVSKELLDTIASNARLRALAATPLLLTLMALLLFRRGILPRDRPKLYEEILELLLGQWDKVRAGQSLADAIGCPDWTSERLRPLLDRLSYEAHLAGSSHDGRGRLERGRVRDALIEFFEKAKLPDAWGAAQRCLSYFEQRSGLLAADDPSTYVFAHLTLQEHCAGRHLLLSRDPVAQVVARRHEDRWREPIFLGLGVIQATNPYLVEKLLRTLVMRQEGEQAKADGCWYRDLILAAELGHDRDWSYLREQEVDVAGLQADLRRGLVTLLADRAQPLPVAERVRAGFLLGDLGDPRFPVAIAQWQAELARRNEDFGQSAGYWCYVREGSYRIGGWDADEQAAEIALPTFWLARYPITVAQFAPFVAVGYGPEAERWWTPNGWQWKQQRDRTEPWGWRGANYNSPNQPVIGANWYEASAYCVWLSEQLQPSGYVVRLPTEAEWEAAAAYDAQGQRRIYPWGEVEPTPELAIYDASKLGWPAPVGCCPAGAAPCGALDMVGNVWEWTCSHGESYPARSGVISDDFVQSKDFSREEMVVPLRGGGWGNDSANVRCGARRRNLPGNLLLNVGGFRVILSPRSHIDSEHRR